MRRVAVDPADRFWIFVIPRDVSTNLPREVWDRGKDAERQQVAFDLRKPEFHLVQPRGVGRREMQMHVWMLLKKGLDRLRFVSREIVHDHVDLSTARLARDDVRQELHEGGTHRSCRMSSWVIRSSHECRP